MTSSKPMRFVAPSLIAVLFTHLCFTAPAMAQSTYSEQLKTFDRDDIHSIHRKIFLKEGRHELGVSQGFIANNDGYGITSAVYQYHLLENLGIEALGGIAYRTSDSERLTLGQVSAIFSPLYGKVSLFTWAIANFDIYLAGGAGMVRYDGIRDGTTFMGNVGLGQRFFINQTFSVRIEYRDFIFRRELGGTNNRTDVQHNHTVSAGLSVLIPFSQAY